MRKDRADISGPENSVDTNADSLPQALWLKHKEVESYFTNLKASIAGNLVNSLAIIWLFYGKLPSSAITLFSIVVLIITAQRVFGLYQFKRSHHAHCYHDWWGYVRAQVALLAVFWAVTIAGLISNSDAAETAFLGMVAAGMMASVVVNFSNVEGAIKIYMGFVVIPVGAALLRVGTPLSYTSAVLLGSFSFVLLRASRISYKNFVDHISKERVARQNAETIKLLLNDFEENASDWLWEIDSCGSIVNPSARFAEAAERPLETLSGSKLIDLFALCPERDILNHHLKSVRHFRDITLSLLVGGEQRWWSLSGQPYRGVDNRLRLRGVATDISATKNAEVKMAYMAHYDGLTDLPNRFLFNDTLNRALHRQKPGQETAVLSLDLDHFKSINDTLGHPAGDALLQVISRRVESCLKERDIVARMGGDEFAILMTGVKDRAAVERIANRILQSIHKPVDLDGHQVLVAGSIGVVIAGHSGANAEMLMKHVDLALYSAKAGGRNRFAFFETEMDDAAQVRRSVEVDLRAALSRDELSLHYQPLINLESGDTVGYEALVRWQHPTRGLVMPNDFVPIAEETGLIVQLGEWVIRNAVAEAARWPEQLSVSINLSPLQMKSGSLISTIVNAIAGAQVDPHRVEFEITETVLMHETEVNLATLHRLREIGVRIALDDFGTGYSSLNYLRSFPFDKIKIDRCFIENVDSREDCQAIVRAVTSLATSLGMVTTAEGVENIEQLDQLKIEGCTQVQGFLFSKAVPADELTNLRSRKSTAPLIERTSGTLLFLPPADLPVIGDPHRIKAVA